MCLISYIVAKSVKLFNFSGNSGKEFKFLTNFKNVPILYLAILLLGTFIGKVKTSGPNQTEPRVFVYSSFICNNFKLQ